MSTETGSIVERILTEIQGLDPEGRTLLYEVLEKRRIKESGEAIALRCDETMREYKSGKLKAGTPEVLFANLEHDV